MSNSSPQRHRERKRKNLMPSGKSNDRIGLDIKINVPVMRDDIVLCNGIQKSMK